MRRWIAIIILPVALAFIFLRIEHEDRPEHIKDVREDITLPPRPSLEKRATGLRNVTPERVLPAPKLENALLERLPAVEPPPPPPKPPKPVQWTRTEVLTSGRLKSGEQIIELSGIQPVPLDKKCLDEDRHEWPCGMFARTELQRFIRGRPVECDPVEQDNHALIKTRCFLSGYDISGWIVWQGWARPSPDLYGKELHEAQAKQNGMWRKRAPGR